MKTIKVPQLAWYDTGELKLPLPDGWRVEVNNMAGYNRPAMTDDQIRQTLSNLIGSPPIREIARGKKEVGIIFDDICRVTRVSRIAPFVLEELAAAGIPDNRIRFIGASGTHAAMNRAELAKKVGEAVMARFPVYNHNPFYNCTYVGTTSRGTKVHINSEFMNCDFKIAIGSITPHVFAIFSGGSKIILPGVASVETILHNHDLKGDAATMANYDTNVIHLDMDEAADMVGLNVNIEGIFNLWGETVALFAGELKQSHAAGIQAARAHYLTKKAGDKDIVIANSFAKAVESITGFKVAFPSVKQSGGDVVLICNTPAGQAVHYLLGPWGKTITSVRNIRAAIPANVNRVIVYTEYPDLAGLGYIEKSEKILPLYKWSDVLKVLREAHGDKADVAVYPNSDVQYFG